MVRSFAAYVIVAGWLLTSFLVQRAFIFRYLADDNSVSPADVVIQYAVGGLSDIWVSFLLSHLILIFFVGFRQLQKKILLLQKYMSVAVLLLVGFVASLFSFHHSYVEFFGFTLHPVHLRYFTDLDFLVANGAGDVSFESVMTAVCSFSLFALCYRIFKGLNPSGLQAAGGYLAILLFATSAHSANIIYRDRLELVDTLKMNTFEKLIVELEKDVKIEPLTSEEISGFFQTSRPGRQLLYSSVAEVASESVTVGFVNEFREVAKVEMSKPAGVILVIMESLRAFEFPRYFEGMEGSETSPLSTRLFLHLEKSLVVNNMYSTGTVTRGGQEALICGYPGAMNTSTMTNRRDIQLKCLTDFMAKREDVFSLWFHGGSGAFDSQRPFWISHGFDVVESKVDFEDQSSEFGWGISDRAFFDQALAKYLKMASDQKMNFSVFLSSSNHVPWKIPESESDAYGVGSKQFNHPSHRSAAYSMEALSDFFDGLKSSGLWDTHLVIVAGDHGHPYKSYTPSNSKNQRYTNVAFALTGGITESVLEKMGRLNVENLLRDLGPRSQLDVSLFIASLFGLNDFQTLGEDLFSLRRFEVFSDLGDRLYFPANGEVIKKSDFFSSHFELSSKANLKTAENGPLEGSKMGYRLLWHDLLYGLSSM